jgi:opacity protein-like surface antigen
VVDHGDRQARLCVGSCAPLWQRRRRLGCDQQSVDFDRRGRPASFTGVNNTTTSTWTAGFGLEWAFYGNWLVRAEYDFIALPTQSLTVAPATPTFGGDVITFNNRNLSIFTAAINYKFGGW